MTELAYTRAELHDHTMTDFVDLFHHRALSQLYRAWFVSQDTASLDRQSDENSPSMSVVSPGWILKNLMIPNSRFMPG